MQKTTTLSFNSAFFFFSLPKKETKKSSLEPTPSPITLCLAKQNKLASAFLLGMDILLCSNSILFLTPSQAMGPDVVCKRQF
jgi:hypothetical protein